MEITFSFGKNWQKFLKNLNEERFKNAEKSLTQFMELETFEGKTFLDIGCGSGLFSYAAFNLGADKVVSLDFDPFSVECCKHLHEKVNKPKNWEIYQGSILDKKFVSKLNKFDIVYSWGVLHHTGKMWQAIKNAACLVNKDGYYYISIYNKIEGRKGSEFWLIIKKIYNHSPRIGKLVMEMLYILRYEIIGNLISLRNPLTIINEYKARRGMEWKTDIVDWLGGLPYEFAKVDEIFKFMKVNFTDFDLVNIKTTDSLGTNWFLFKNKGHGLIKDLS
ncbi:MAG: class I SAM-dependent methyltransferase [Candidatus Scalindua sp.]|nr:class I SAM-dependent methyltransferase [Candidatus Scalindua sp.]